MRVRLILTWTFILFPFLLFSQIKESSNVQFNASYISDFGRNFTGGIKQDNFYLGLMNLSMTIPVFKNGEIYLQMQNTHGSTPSADIVGDMQVFSNIENGDFTYLYSAWYRQGIGNFSITFGVHDLNSEFNVTEFGGLFTNSSFGIQPSISWNMPAPIFPKNALGIILQYQVTDNLSIMTSIYDGDPGVLDDDRYNMDFTVDVKNQGVLSISELQYHLVNNGKLQASYKLGFEYHSARFCSYSDSSFVAGNYGMYFIADQYFTDNIGVFVQFGWSPATVNVNSLYAGLGTNINIGKQKKHVFGLAASYVSILKDYCKYYQNTNDHFESGIELFIRFQLNKHISIQPDIQYIINPGVFANLPNALVGFTRLSINF